jgi:hypothetical protein
MAPGRPFDGFVEQTKRVTPTCLVHFERNRYSVPASFANRPVSLRINQATEDRPFPALRQLLKQLSPN